LKQLEVLRLSAMSPIHTFVFDLDDTLFAESDFVASGFAAVDAWLLANHKVANFRREAAALFAAGRRRTVFDAALERLQRPATPKLIAELVHVYREHFPSITLLPDAASTLSWAYENGRVALLTDGYRVTQENKVKALALTNRFECIVFTDELGREFWKPHPAGFCRIMKELAGPPEGYIYIADNPRKDFIAPRALGWKTARIRRAGGEHAAVEAMPHEAADCEVSNLPELRELFVRWP
jgi:putative hydrolase of the HAD superfamily